MDLTTRLVCFKIILYFYNIEFCRKLPRCSNGTIKLMTINIFETGKRLEGNLITSGNNALVFLAIIYSACFYRYASRYRRPRLAKG